MKRPIPYNRAKKIVRWLPRTFTEWLAAIIGIGLWGSLLIRMMITEMTQMLPAPEWVAGLGQWLAG